MALKIKVETVPHTNKDGSLSEHRKDYIVKVKVRGERTRVAMVASSAKVAESAVNTIRTTMVNRHLMAHPSDLAFKRKHGID